MQVDIPIRSVRERQLALVNVPFFGSLSVQRLQILAESSAAHAFDPASNVPLETHLHIVVSGQAEHVFEGRTLQSLSENDAIGGLSLFCEEAEALRARSIGVLTTLAIERSLIRELIEEDFDALRLAIARTAARIVQSANGLPIRSETPPTAERLAALEARDSLVGRLRVLNNSVFDQGSLDASFDIARSMESIKLNPGTVVFEEGEPSDWWLFQLDGKILCENQHGSIELEGDSSLGGLSAMARAPRAYRATAVETTHAYRIHLESLMSVLEIHNDLALALLRTMSKGVWFRALGNEHFPPINND